MNSGRSTGRIVGLLLVTHLIVGLMVPFIMLDRVKRAVGLVQGAAAHPGEVRAAVLLLFLGSALAVVITITAFPILRRCSQAMTLALLAIAITGVALQAADSGAIFSALSLSQEYAQAGAAKAELFQGLALVVNTARKWTHYCSLLFMVGWIFMLSTVLYRFRLVPRVLAALGMLASAMQILGVTVRGFMGYPPEARLAMPLAPVYVALGIWLMAKGFDEGQHLVAEADSSFGTCLSGIREAR